MLSNLFKRLSYSYRHHDYHKWIGPEDGYLLDGTRRGMEHFVYTDKRYNAIIDWIMLDVFKMEYTWNYSKGVFSGWSKYWDLDLILKKKEGIHDLD